MSQDKHNTTNGNLEHSIRNLTKKKKKNNRTKQWIYVKIKSNHNAAPVSKSIL